MHNGLSKAKDKLAGDQVADAFSMRMTYQTADYTETPQYNGNIASLSWRAPLGTCRDIQGYHFTYDAANRLKAATFWERTTGSPTINDKYSEPLINYDLNGNITQYQRRGLTTGTTYDQIDLMAYAYDATNPDRLYRIADLAPSASRPYGFKPKGVPSYYGYDNAGNMTSDGHKDLTMAYNALNLPDVFTFANVTPNNKIEIVYNAAGEKLEKQVYTGATLSLHKRYVMGIEYTGANLEAIYHAEGRIVPIGGGVFRYEYTLKDHLGNSRVMFAANGTAIQLLQENHYYPFGMEMKGAWITQSGTENGYQYNGKELNEDWGLNWSDYGARWYDASVGRWGQIDPHAVNYPSFSGYHYCANNPIIITDPTGKDWYVNNKSGEYEWFDGNEKREGYTGVGYYKVEYNQETKTLSIFKGKEAERVTDIDMSLDKNGKYKSEEAATFALISAELGSAYVNDEDPTIQPLIIGAIIDNRQKLINNGASEFGEEGDVQSLRGFQAMADKAYKDFSYGHSKRYGEGKSAFQKRLANIGLSTTYTGTLDAASILEKYYNVEGEAKFHEMVYYAHGSGNTVNGDYKIEIPRGTNGFQYVRGSNQHKKTLAK